MGQYARYARAHQDNQLTSKEDSREINFEQVHLT